MEPEKHPVQSWTDGLNLAADKAHGWVDGFYILLPNIIAGVVFLLIFIVIAFAARFSTTKYFELRGRVDLGRILSSLSQLFFTLLGIGVALTIIMPSVNPGDLVASLGIGSVAIGFVFKDILQNWFSGLLILLRLPFRRGDQISVNGVEGTVIRVDPRATVLRTYDGRDVVVPNTIVYSTNVIIHTSMPHRRVELDLTVGYNYQIRTITEIIQTALDKVDQVLKDPPPQILCWELGSTSLGIKVRWWIKSDRSEEVISRARAVQAIKEAFEANDIDPTDPQLVFYHEAENIKSIPSSLQSMTTNKAEVTQEGPPPPEVAVSDNDPESEQPKIDSKQQTLLPE